MSGLVKFDLPGLGMLTALRISFMWLADHGVHGTDGKAPDLHNLPQEDPRVYRAFCKRRIWLAFFRWNPGPRWPPCHVCAPKFSMTSSSK